MKKVLLACAGVLLLSLGLCLGHVSARQAWPGVDDSVVGRLTREARGAAAPEAEAGEGDFLKFAFLIAGVAGGFALGYYSRKVFGEKRVTESPAHV